jgi:class 3 adenylate cyclase
MGSSPSCDHSEVTLPLRNLLALGLITFWVYPALRLAHALRAHFAQRWAEVESRAELRSTDPRFAALRVTGFSAGLATPWIASVLFACSALFTAFGVVPAASALFYAGAAVLMLWTLSTVRRHETLELHVRERGAAALLERPELGDEVARRRELQASHVIAFLVLAGPMLFSPMIAPALAVPLLALFHVWGIRLLVSLYNDHLAEEARHAATAAGPALLTTADKPQRARVAIMLTDMQDYSKAMGMDESGAYARLVEHNRMMRAAIAAHRGREIKTIGDAFLVIFRSARNAVDCARAAQRGFADYNAGRREGERILVRIGIHRGEVILTGSDIFGDDVNLVARMEPLASPGGICISEPVFKIVRKTLRLDDVQPIEGATLKNIASPPRLYRLRPGA